MIRGRSAWLDWSAAAHEGGSDRKSMKSRSWTSKSSRSSQAAELTTLGEMRRQSYALSVEQSPVVNQRAPMFVLPVKDVIGLDGLRTHEELQAMGKLVEWEAGMGDVMFVSQTWLRKEHPDDEQGSKFKLLKVAAPGHSVALPYGPCPTRATNVEALCVRTPCAAVCPCPICAAAAPATGFLGAEVLGFFGMFGDVWGEFGGAFGIQALLMRALAGKLDIASFWAVEAIYGKDIGYSAAEMKQRLSSGFVWFDIWSVPQIDCAKKKASTLPLASPCEPLQPVAHTPCTPAYTCSHFLQHPSPRPRPVQGGHPLHRRLHRDVVLALHGARWPVDARKRGVARLPRLGEPRLVPARARREHPLSHIQAAHRRAVAQPRGELPRQGLAGNGLPALARV